MHTIKAALVDHNLQGRNQADFISKYKLECTDSWHKVYFGLLGHNFRERDHAGFNQYINIKIRV